MEDFEATARGGPSCVFAHLDVIDGLVDIVAGLVGASRLVSASRLAATDAPAVVSLDRTSTGFDGSNSTNFGALVEILEVDAPSAASRAASLARLSRELASASSATRPPSATTSPSPTTTTARSLARPSERSRIAISLPGINASTVAIEDHRSPSTTATSLVPVVARTFNVRLDVPSLVPSAFAIEQSIASSTRHAQNAFPSAPSSSSSFERALTSALDIVFARAPLRVAPSPSTRRPSTRARTRTTARVDRVAVASTAPRPAMAPSEGIFHKRRCDRWNPIGIF